jgi:general secretion pathway protein B
MSLILDALRRSESERSATATSGRGNGPSHDVRMRRPLPVTTLVLINLTVFLAGAALAMWLLRSALGLTPTPPTATTAAPAPAPTPVATPARAATPATPAVLQAPAQPTPVEPVPAASVHNADAATEPEATPSEPPASVGSVDPEAYASLDDIAPLYASPYDASSEWPVETATPAASQPRQSAPAPSLDPAAFAAALAQQAASDPAQGAVGHTEPQLRDMPAAYRAQFPALTVQVHVYDDDPQRRWVLIDGRRYTEGGTLAAGPELVSIEADGVVLNFRGESIWWPLQR